MPAELATLAARLRSIAEASPLTRDFSLGALRRGLREVVAGMSVYRTYVDDQAPDDRDRREIAIAIAKATHALPLVDRSIFAFIEAVLTGTTTTEDSPEIHAAVLDCAMRVQQFTGPVMAKGLEDTALYRANRLIAVNDVGSIPDRFSESVAAFHDFNTARAEALPHGMLASSTHDSKRGEDVRARIAALSGFPEAWSTAVEAWQATLEAEGAPGVDRNDLYYFFQTVLGAWPAAFSPEVVLHSDAITAFRERVQGAMLKSLREARVHTSWTLPNEIYEQAMARLVDIALAPDSEFLSSVRSFEDRIGLAGARNGIVATILKLTAPGVPDIYQGAELWEQSMVDPDNRRPVDYAQRLAQLSDVSGVGDLNSLLPTWRTGGVKLAVIRRLLVLRRDHPELFSAGSYEALPVTGPDAYRALAFCRTAGDKRLIVICALGSWNEPLRLLVDIPVGEWHDVLRAATLKDGPTDITELTGDLTAAVLFSAVRPS